MNTNDTESNDNQEEPLSMSRRQAFKTLGTAAAAATMGIGSATEAAEPGATPPEGRAQNPYGGGPNTGITLPYMDSSRFASISSLLD